MPELEFVEQCLCRSAAAGRVLVARDQVTGESFTYTTCSDCGLERLSPRPTLREIGLYYPDDCEPYHDDASSSQLEKVRLLIYQTFWAPEAERPAWPRAARLILRMVLYPLRWHSVVFFPTPREKFVFEFGASSGHNLLAFRGLGWQVSGCEPSAFACETAAKRGIYLQNCTAETAAIPDGVGCIYMNNVFEHLHLPDAVLARCRSVLAPGGLVALVVPNHAPWAARLFGAAWPGYDPPRHLWGYSPASLKILLQRAGFDVISVGQRFPLSDHCWHAGINGYRLRARPQWRIRVAKVFRRFGLLVPLGAMAALFGRADYLCVVARKGNWPISGPLAQ